MGDNSAISWCDATWQVIAGCSHEQSAGCAHCYSARLLATRQRHLPWAAGLAEMVDGRPRWTGKVVTRPDQLGVPLRWRRGRRVFVGDRGDLFHREVPEDYICQVFETMDDCRQHQFLVLTKRPERAADVLRHLLRVMPHVWMGVSASTQRDLVRVVPPLLRMPAAHRVLSLEPLLSEVQIRGEWLRGLSWVIIGCESGPQARPCSEDWIRRLVLQCKNAGVPVFVKQIQGLPRVERHDLRWAVSRDPTEWPYDLRAQQWPEGWTP